MKTSIFLLLLINFVISFSISASIYLEQPIEQQIENAQLIVKGLIIDKKTKNEEHFRKFLIIENGEKSEVQIIGSSPYTTFSLKIDEVLLGSYTEDQITIKMEGGCTKDGVCLDVSYNYDFQTNDEVVIFLNFDKSNNFYHSTEAGITAFRIEDNGELITTKTYTPVSNLLQKKIIGSKKTLSVDKLKSKIQKVLDAK